MKNGNTVSAIVGGAFFAIPYLALSLPVIPSLVIGASAFAAGELVFTKREEIEAKQRKQNLKKVLEKANEQNKHIFNMINRIEDKDMRKDLTEISNSVNKILDTVNKDINKVKNVDNFFDYYLPITVKIVDRYDEIENQNLSSKESKKICDSTKKMLKDINFAFNKILNSLYENDIMDMDAEMKVFNSMLKGDGFDSNQIDVED